MFRISRLSLVVGVAMSVVCASRAGPIQKWEVCGPFAAAGLLDRVAASEGALSPARDRDVRGRAWKAAVAIRGVVGLKGADRLGLEDNQCAFAHATVHADRAQERWLAVRSDDAVAVWINGRQALVQDVLRGMDSGPDRILVRLREGDNDLLLKIFNAGGDWAFSAVLEGD